MGVKKYFTGKSGALFWLNVILGLAVLVGVPLGAFYLLDDYTHHGEKITVPSVIGKDAYSAAELLNKNQLICIIGDSTYRAKAKPGTILEQSPLAGSVVKSGHIIYLTINLNGEPLISMPDIVNNSSLREAEAKLRSLGFKLAPCEYVDNYPRDLVVGVKQGMKEVHSGDLISRDRALTIMAGAGLAQDTLDYLEDTLIVETPADFEDPE